MQRGLEGRRIAVYARDEGPALRRSLEADEMSEQSFPASDPPSTTPVSIGHLKPDRGGGARA